jgi:inorganic triphosphatase YgiF
VKLDDAVVEIAQVTGMITTDNASMPFQEFEVRLVSGSVAALFTVAREWSTRHGLGLGIASNGERGARLAAGHPDGFPTTATLPEAPFADGASFLRATLDSCLMQILANAGVIGEGSQDRHVIDQLQHGLERLRTTIAELAPMTSGIDEAWQPVLKRTFHELASHHSATALRAPLIQEMRAAGLGYALGSSHPRETRSPSAIVQDPEFQFTLLAILAYRHALAPLFRPDHGTLKQMQRRFADELVERQESVADDADNLRSTSRRRSARRHLDHLYRLATFASPLFEARQVDSFLVRCRVAQDAFAADSEHRSGLEALEDDGEGGTDVKLARRWLAARLADDRKACESLLRRVGKAAAFWTA